MWKRNRMVQETIKTQRIIGIGVVGPGEASRYMRATMEEFKRLCDEVILITNNATPQEIQLIDEYGFHHFPDTREWGKEQPNIKTTLLTKAADLKPDWIVALDMDERFAPEVTKEVLQELTQKGERAWKFMVVNLYNDEQHFAHDKGIQRFWNVRFYKFMPELGLQFLRRSLHCGLGPPYAYSLAWHAPYYLLHYGLLKKEDRDRRVERYRKYDPNAKFKGKEYYEDLAKELRMIPFHPENLLALLQNSVDCKKRVPPKIT